MASDVELERQRRVLRYRPCRQDLGDQVGEAQRDRQAVAIFSRVEVQLVSYMTSLITCSMSAEPRLISTDLRSACIRR
jgi:hypothetical protein